MARTVFGVVGGFIAWAILWFGSERVLTALSPAWFGAQQAAFQAAIETGGNFDPDTTFLAAQIVLGSLVSVLAGFLSAVIAGENKRAPLILGFLLLAMGLLKAFMSWAIVPIWYHAFFTGMLAPMAIIGGKFKRTK